MGCWSVRLQGWEKSLSDYIESIVFKEFKWGECDCLIFASDACKLVCGVDPMLKKFEDDPDTIRGAYETENEAYSLIEKYRKSMPNIMDVHFNRIDNAYASRGDVVLAKLETGYTFGVVSGRGVAFFKSEKGLIQEPVSKAKYIWKVE